MDLKKRTDLIKQVGEEIITEEELRELLKKEKRPIAYDGFEPSGNIHIAQGILRAVNINKMTKAGCKFNMYVADWHAWANNKMGGDLEKIQRVGKYQIEVWKACGLDLKNVEFLWSSDFVRDENYWKLVMQVARNSTIKRMIRCGQILGRSEKEMMQTSQILYPALQTADIFYMKCDICQLGLDQRKVNVFAREIGPKLGFWKPVVVSHHMLMGLKKPPSGIKDPVEKEIAEKMSKSIPDSAIFMTDAEKEVERKMQDAYCPAKKVKENPVMEYMKYIIFESFDSVKIERKKEFGGNVEFDSFDRLAEAYKKGDVHPLDLKKSAARYINKLLDPVRKHFKSGKAAELAEFVKKEKTTR